MFGAAGADSAFARAARLPYRAASTNLICVDDPASAHYNQFVDLATNPQRDWQSHEEMRRSDERYTLGAVIAHNSPEAQPGAGSCIFLHVWQAPGVPTAGCTAGTLAGNHGNLRLARRCRVAIARPATGNRIRAFPRRLGAA